MSVAVELHVARAALRARDVRLVVAAGSVAVVLASLTVGTGFAGQRGGLGAVLFGWNALTYALAATLAGGALAGAHVSTLADVLHASGLSRLRLLVVVTVCGLGLAAVAVAAGWSALFLLGVIEAFAAHGALQLGPPYAVGPAAVVRDALREAVVFLGAGVLGGLLGLAAGRRLVAVLAAALVTLPYVPFATVAAARVGELFDVLPYLPFGSLRATFGGGGGVATDDLAAARWISPALAGALAACWLFVSAGAAALRLRGTGAPVTRAGRRRLLLAVAAICAALAGALVPASVSGSVPWRWQPVWRDAVDRGWATHQVAARWAAALAAEGDAGGLYAAGAARPDAALTAPLALATRVESSTEAELVDPRHAVVAGVFEPPLRRPGVAITRVSYSLGFARVEGRYVIVDVQGPLVEGR